MFRLSIYFFLPIIDALVIVKTHQNSFYHPQSSCSFLRNALLSNDASMQSCIWECVNEYDCQTAVYFHDNKTCSIFVELCTTGTIESYGNDRASVICYRKNHQPTITCSSTLTTIVDITTDTMETTITTTQDTVPLTSIFWSFDSNFNDLYNVYNGVSMGNAGFISPGYTGYGSALSVDASMSQYVLVSKFLNMTYTSFTWEMWAYPISFAFQYNVMIGMCESIAIDKCLYLMINGYTTYFAFWGDDCQSSTIVDVGQWHHFAFVFDYIALTKYVYLNGGLVCINHSLGPYQGNSGAITIGAIIDSAQGTPDNYWKGYIDQVSYVSRAKTADEILIDATLVAYYSFDNGSFYDSGPNKINGTGFNISSTQGRINEGILFNKSEAYFQASGFTLLGVSYRSYSIALWIYKLSPAVGNGTIVHLSSLSNGLGWCITSIGLTSFYDIVGQSYNYSMISITGPTLPLGVWTHVVTSYSVTNGVSLWVNGTLIGSSGSFSYASSNVPNTITLGSALNGTSYCAHGPVAAGQFYGMIDELRIYSRELNASDVYALVNR